MDSTVISTIITATVTLLVSVGTWHVSAKASRKKDQEEIRAIIEGYRKEIHDKMTELEQSVSQVNASVQQHIATIEIKIDTLSEHVEKHNKVVERTYQLEQTTAVQTEQIKVANHRIEDLERRCGS